MGIRRKKGKNTINKNFDELQVNNISINKKKDRSILQLLWDNKYKILGSAAIGAFIPNGYSGDIDKINNFGDENLIKLKNSNKESMNEINELHSKYNALLEKDNEYRSILNRMNAEKMEWGFLQKPGINTKIGKQTFMKDFSHLNNK